MLSKLRSLLLRPSPPPPLLGRPKVRREKSYSADSGYVYQYFHEGYRETTLDGELGAEYVFDVSSDRKARFRTTVFLGSRVVEQWQEENSRELNMTERYALVKMTLFEALDEREGSEAAALVVRAGVADISRHAESLDF